MSHPLPDFSNWTCPLPLRDYPNIVMAHGGGGKLTQELVENIFLPAFQSPELAPLSDAAVLTVAPGRLALSTDSYVVRPLFFPGSSIGELAVNGTVNDLSMQGARPLFLSAGFILEEGLPIPLLAEVVARMAAAARAAGVRIVTGDTKVVERGSADQLFINTAGIGVIPDAVDLGPQRIQPGDQVLVSGTIGDHGLAIMSVREGLEFDSPILSDCAPLHLLAQALLESPQSVRMLRDATRGGVSAVLNEIASAARLGITLDEKSIPVRPAVQAACELLGLDPLYVANEGKFIAIVAPESAEELLGKLRAMPGGQSACRIGEVHSAQPGLLSMRTLLNTRRVVPMPLGEQLPRIC
jgi:hydrogenase expression/formation protein HypE